MSTTRPAATLDRLDELLQPLGRLCGLPDGGRGRILAVAITGPTHRIEYHVAWWYQGQRHEAWMEPCEIELPRTAQATEQMEAAEAGGKE